MQAPAPGTRKSECRRSCAAGSFSAPTCFALWCIGRPTTFCLKVSAFALEAGGSEARYLSNMDALDSRASPATAPAMNSERFEA